MALRKLFIVLDCDDEAQKEAVQNALNDISNMRILKGADIIRMKPLFDKNRNELMQLFNMIKTGGAKSLLSIQGGMLLRKFTK